MKWVVVSLFLMVVVLGCVASPPIVEKTDQPPAIPPATTPEVSPPAQDPVVDALVCDAADAHDREECFEDAFETCQKVSASFWTTSDGFELHFASLGFDDSGNCLVLVSVPPSESQFSGQSADCTIEKSPASGEHAEAYFDVYSLGPDTCVGTYTDAIVKSADDDSTETPTTPPVAAPVPKVKEFSFSVDDDGVIGTKEFVVSKGDTVRLTITVAASNVSFGGDWVRAPAGTKLENEADYIFTTGNLSPGGSKTVEFTADESFEFGIYWPGSNVLKGKGKITVEN